MRALLASAAVLFALAASAQSPEENPLRVPPDLVIVVSKQALGSDLIQITARNADYPTELLAAQIKQLATLLNSEARGLYIYPVVPDNNPRLRSVVAQFAVDGIIDRAKGELHIQPIVRAFAGAPAGLETKGIHLLFENEKPQNGMLQTLSHGKVRLAGSASQSPPGIEYRILLLSQQPSELVVPSKVEQKAVTPSPQGTRAGNLNPIVIPLLLTGGGVAALLVYFGFRSPRRRSVPTK